MFLVARERFDLVKLQVLLSLRKYHKQPFFLLNINKVKDEWPESALKEWSFFDKEISEDWEIGNLHKKREGEE